MRYEYSVSILMLKKYEKKDSINRTIKLKIYSILLKLISFFLYNIMDSFKCTDIYAKLHIFIMLMVNVQLACTVYASTNLHTSKRKQYLMIKIFFYL